MSFHIILALIWAAALALRLALGWGPVLKYLTNYLLCVVTGLCVSMELLNASFFGDVIRNLTHQG